jgi:hypothetical protein
MLASLGRRYWRARKSVAVRSLRVQGVLRALAAHGEAYIDADDLAAILGKKSSGGHWNSGIAVLRNNGLIETDGRRYRAAVLFRE